MSKCVSLPLPCGLAKVHIPRFVLFDGCYLSKSDILSGLAAECDGTSHRATHVILTRYNTVVFLVNAGLLSIGDLIERNIEVRCLARRHGGFSVLWEGNRGFYVKQHKAPVGRQTLGSPVALEAALLKQFRCYSSIRERVPQLRVFDASLQALVLDWISDARPFNAGLYSAKACDAARLLGQDLAALHLGLKTHHAALSAELPFISMAHPWPLHLTQWRSFSDKTNSPAQAEWIAHLRGQADLMAALQRLGECWPKEQLIHGDMKWQNCLIAASHTSDSWPAPCRFVDWSLAGLGDPLWDVAGLVQSWIKAWLNNVDIDTSGPPYRVATFDVEAFLPCRRLLAAFWQAYCADAISAQRGVRLVELLGARLLQTLFEDAAEEAQTTPTQALLLHFARFLLMAPEDGAVQLLGSH